MPKVTGTRRQKIAELLDRLNRGPAFSSNFDGSPYTPDNAKGLFQLWSNSWIIPALVKLFPEFRGAQLDQTLGKPRQPMADDSRVELTIKITSTEPNYPLTAAIYALQDLIETLEKIPQEDHDVTNLIRLAGPDEFAPLEIWIDDQRKVAR